MSKENRSARLFSVAIHNVLDVVKDVVYQPPRANFVEDEKAVREVNIGDKSIKKLRNRVVIEPKRRR